MKRDAFTKSNLLIFIKRAFHISLPQGCVAPDIEFSARGSPADAREFGFTRAMSTYMYVLQLIVFRSFAQTELQKTDAIQSTTAIKCQITIQKTQQQLNLSFTTVFSVNCQHPCNKPTVPAERLTEKKRGNNIYHGI